MLHVNSVENRIRIGIKIVCLHGEVKMKGRKDTILERERKIAASSSERRKIFKELLRHIESGFSLESFGPLSDVSIKKYLKTYPEDFIEEELEEAMRKGRSGWEMIGKKQATGECLGNSRSWYYNMANRYGWREKVDLVAEHKGQVNVSVVSYASTQGLQDSEGHE